mmetsp:Transcript_21647/g.31359  ORF Transcript_21647/g.31359 Transcript_21647/m.31359 type:complete len:146 (+) Transcript_21647:25-462(+)
MLCSNCKLVYIHSLLPMHLAYVSTNNIIVGTSQKDTTTCALQQNDTQMLAKRSILCVERHGQISAFAVFAARQGRIHIRKQLEMTQPHIEGSCSLCFDQHAFASIFFFMQRIITPCSKLIGGGIINVQSSILLHIIHLDLNLNCL